MTNTIFSAAILCFVLASSSVNAETIFRLSTRNEPIPENGVVAYTVLRADENEFAFLPPPQWKLEVDQKKSSLSWTSPDFRSLIQIQIQVNAGTSNNAAKLNSEELKAALVARHKQTKILEQFPCYTSGLSGIAFDWERSGEGGFIIRHRSAFIPIAGGYAELTLATPSDQFEKRHMDLMRLLNSFRANHLGPQLSEQKSEP